MKKILLFLMLLFGFIQNTFADDVVYYNPTYIYISDSASSDGTPEDDDYIRSDSADQFCIELGGTLVSQEDKKEIGFARYNSNQGVWVHKDNYKNVLKSVTCDIQKVYFAGLNSNANPLDSDIPIFVANNGVIYINKDNFFYMVVTSAVILLLFRSVIYLFQLSFYIGKNLATGRGLKINKK